MSQRLNKYLAHSLGISRRTADEIIASGQIVVNAKTAEIGQKVEFGDTVLYRGKPVKSLEQSTLIMLNKPVGYVCSRAVQGDSKTVYDLLPEQYRKLKTVGRLDKNSSGLILLTDDGDFSHRMTHPSFHKNKTYLVTLDKPLEPLHQQMISDFGIQLEDGPSQLTLERLDDSRQCWRISMHEGRNRQIRRTFQALDYNVKKLHRTQFGPYSLDSLKTGQYKPLDI